MFIHHLQKVVSEIYAGEGGKFCLFVNSRKPTPIDGLSMRGLEEMLDEIFISQESTSRYQDFMKDFMMQ